MISINSNNQSDFKNFGSESSLINLKEDEIIEKAKELLKKAMKKTQWQSICGYNKIPLLIGEQFIGWLIENVDLDELEPKDYRFAGQKVKIRLMNNGKAVGNLLIPFNFFTN